MNRKLIATAVLAGTAVLSGYASAQSYDAGFGKRVYIGVGAGESRLEPDTSQDPDFDLLEKNDTGSTITLGLDFSRRLTAEIQYADLGVAGLNGDGIEYSEASISGLYYLWNGFGSSDYLDHDGLDRRAGLSFFGRLGVGKMENEPQVSVEFTRKNDVQLMAGIGIEYGLNFGLGVRAEFINFDTDAKYRGVSVLYRFGGARPVQKSPQVPSEPLVPELPTLPAPEPVETLPPPPPPPPEFLTENSAPSQPAVSSDDSDSDGIVNSLDDCFDTPTGTPVNSRGCAMFNGTLDGVNFLTGSDTLTDLARSTLDDVVATLVNFPEVRVSVHAHTDSQGLESANFDLSRKRALAVVRYLTAQGISLDRLEARAFGETQPIATNDTRDGRLLNRRVEFRTVQ